MSKSPTIQPIRKLLIANRGEIAIRIARTCRRLGIATVAVYSDADADAPFVRAADEALHIGPAAPSESYLNVEVLLAAARNSGADAVHPGYGFLSENAGFARACTEAGLRFVGPSPEAIEAMGSKSRAKAIMEEHGVPVVPGYRGEDQSEARLLTEAERIGFPLLVKAAAGGGGKGMRIVESADKLKEAIAAAKREAASAFGEDELLLEKYIASGRHVEFQIFGDQHGNTLHLLERECTIQRRYQKVIEESPSPALTPAVRKRMGEAAVQAARALNYHNAGTVEFMLEGHGDAASFYFLEVNTRLQVEHPVTELVTGLDLVEWQIAVAEGRALPLEQAAVQAEGYAIQCRLYAEDPARDFMPATGTVQRWEIPVVEGLRADSAVESGSEISVHYDPMIAKLLVHAPDRATAHRRMAYALRHLTCLGTTTNRDFLRRVVEHPEFQAGAYDTHFLDRHPQLAKPEEAVAMPGENQNEIDAHGPTRLPPLQAAALAASVHGAWQRSQRRAILPALPKGWTNNPYGPVPERWSDGTQTVAVELEWNERSATAKMEGHTVEAKILHADAGSLRLAIDGRQSQWAIHRQAKDAGGNLDQGERCWLQHPEHGAFALEEIERFPLSDADAADGGYTAPMPSQVQQVLVQSSQAVEAGAPLVVLLSMKMENTVYATASGTVAEVLVAEGENIEAGALLLRFETEEP